MNRLDLLLQKNKKYTSLYLTAGYPGLDDTVRLCEALERSGIDLIEIGVPFSDPVADGPVIQQSSDAALRNGMSLKVLLEQLSSVRKSVSLPLVLMGYVNPVLQYGLDAFCKSCKECGVDGVILPDLPLEEFMRHHRSVFSEYGLHNILLVSPSSSDERIRIIDEQSTGFIYAVSSAGVTGGLLERDEKREQWLARLQSLNLRHKVFVGFGVSDAKSVEFVHRFADGAIIGSAFIKALRLAAAVQSAEEFVREKLGMREVCLG